MRPQIFLSLTVMLTEVSMTRRTRRTPLPIPPPFPTNSNTHPPEVNMGSSSSNILPLVASTDNSPHTASNSSSPHTASNNLTASSLHMDRGRQLDTDSNPTALLRSHRGLATASLRRLTRTMGRGRVILSRSKPTDPRRLEENRGREGTLRRHRLHRMRPTLVTVRGRFGSVIGNQIVGSGVGRLTEWSG